jgi:hypothetical protein
LYVKGEIKLSQVAICDERRGRRLARERGLLVNHNWVPLLASFCKTLQIKELLNVRVAVREIKELKEKGKVRGIGWARNGLPRGIGHEGKGGPGASRAEAGRSEVKDLWRTEKTAQKQGRARGASSSGAR